MRWTDGHFSLWLSNGETSTAFKEGSSVTTTTAPQHHSITAPLTTEGAMPTQTSILNVGYVSAKGYTSLDSAFKEYKCYVK